MMQKNNIFSLVVSILTLAIITIGTTFAFFSGILQRNDAVSVKSAEINFSFKVNPLYNEKNIIPTEDDDIFTAFYNNCIDDLEFGACYAYTINVINEGDQLDIMGRFKVSNDELPNLKYMILDADVVDENGKYAVYKGIEYAKTEFESIGNIIRLDRNETKNLILVVWLSNVDKEQNKETGKTFLGTLTFDSTLGSKITGTITAIVNE